MRGGSRSKAFSPSRKVQSRRVEATSDCSIPKCFLAILSLSENNVPVEYSSFLLYYTLLFFLAELRLRRLYITNLGLWLCH